MERAFAEGEISGKPAIRNVQGQITLRDIEQALRTYGLRVILLIRHAECPPLDPSDTTFGARLSITKKGRADALAFGGALAKFVHAGDAAVFASETLRTIQTASAILRCIADKESQKSFVVKRCGYLGGKSTFFGSLDERMKLITALDEYVKPKAVPRIDGRKRILANRS